MKVEQVYQIVNNMTKEYIGETAVVNEDLSNIVDIGSATIGLENLDKYVNKLIDQIGMISFVNRPYDGKTPSLFMEAFEFGAIKEKISMGSLPQAELNQTWNLKNGESYDPFIFNGPDVAAKFFSKKDTYDIAMSFAHDQIKSAFRSATELSSFFSMIEAWIQTSMNVKIDQLAMAALNNMTATAINGSNANQRINLLEGYNSTILDSEAITAAEALQTPGFLRYAAYTMGLYAERMQRLSKLFNTGGKERWTSRDRLHMILLSEFAASAKAYLYSDTYHDQFVHLPEADTVPYWQGSGTSYSFSSTSKINVKIKTPTSTADVEQDGILCVMFDRYAVGVSNLRRWVTSQYNGRAEFYNNWYKFDAGYYNDTDENFIVFYVKDAE